VNNSTKPYFENLDLLRFVAATSVFVFHVCRDLKEFFETRNLFSGFSWITKITDKGALGVNFFFVLSGFLITYLILWEIAKKGNFSIKNFLLRRMIRIWPLYFLIILLGFLVFPTILSGFHTEHHVLNYVFFLANFDEIEYGAIDGINFLTSPWSIAVEEQFYVVWGGIVYIVFQLFKSTSIGIKTTIFSLLVVALFFRTMNFDNDRIMYYHTLSVMPDLLIGCLLAVLMHEKNRMFKSLESLKPWQINSIYIFGLCILMIKNLIFTGYLVVFERFVVATFFAFIVADQVIKKKKNTNSKLLKTFQELGKVSYGMYMYHLVILYLLNTYWLKGIYFEENLIFNYTTTTVLYLLVSWVVLIVLSKLSYKYLETPFLNLKSRIE